MSTRNVVLLALASALVGAVITGLVLDRRRAREAVTLAAETNSLRRVSESLALAQAAAVARAVEAEQRAEAQRVRADSVRDRARAQGHRTAALETALDEAATVRDSMDRLVTLTEGLRTERDEWQATAEELTAGWDLERQAVARLRVALALSDSVRAADQARIAALTQSLVIARTQKRGKWLGLFPEPPRSVMLLGGIALGVYVATR